MADSPFRNEMLRDMHVNCSSLFTTLQARKPNPSKMNSILEHLKTELDNNFESAVIEALEERSLKRAFLIWRGLANCAKSQKTRKQLQLKKDQETLIRQKSLHKSKLHLYLKNIFLKQHEPRPVIPQSVPVNEDLIGQKTTMKKQLTRNVSFRDTQIPLKGAAEDEHDDRSHESENHKQLFQKRRTARKSDLDLAAVPIFQASSTRFSDYYKQQPMQMELVARMKMENKTLLKLENKARMKTMENKITVKPENKTLKPVPKPKSTLKM